MILLQGNNISRTFGADVLFEKINFTIQDNSRVSLVGRNGAGKSTLLKIIADVETPSSGEISKTKNLTMSYLAQEADFSSERTIYAEMLSVFDLQISQEKQLRQMEAQMGELTGADLASLMSRYDSLTETFRQNKGFTYESDIKNVLNGFKFDETFWTQSVSSLSGGQKTRLALAKILLENPAFLILDEPTNHLDIETLLWLENYLKNYRGAILIVSHDRYFLDKVTTETLELSRGKLEKYIGNYSKYIELKAEKLATQAKQYDKQQKEIASLEDFVNRNLARASTTKRAQSRRKKLEKMERLDQPLANEKSAHFTFSPALESGNVVLTVENGAVGYDKELLKFTDKQKVSAIKKREFRLTKTDEEKLFLALNKHPNPDFKRIVLLALYTAMRRSEIVTLTWGQIKENYIQLYVTKSGKPRKVYLTVEAKELIKIACDGGYEEACKSYTVLNK